MIKNDQIQNLVKKFIPHKLLHALIIGVSFMVLPLLHANECIEGLRARSKSGKIQITWENHKGTKRYNIFRRLADSASFMRVGEVLSTNRAKASYLDVEMDLDVLYFYQIQRIFEDGSPSCFSEDIAAVAPSVRTRMSTVPDVIGISQEQAESELINARLVLGDVAVEPNDTFPVGDVFEQEFPPNSFVPSDTAISVKVSMGESTITVPNLLGLSQSEAAVVVLGADLQVGMITEQTKVSLPTGTVIRQTPSPGNLVPEDFKVDLTVVEPPASTPDEIVPESWEGKWEITITYFDPDTNVIDSVSESLDEICPFDPLGFTQLEGIADADPDVDNTECSRQVTDEHIAAACTTEITFGFCPVEVTLEMTMDLAGIAISGEGFWTVTNACGIPLPSNGQTFEISGVRLEPAEETVCQAPQSSFLQKFMRNQLFIFLQGRL